MSSTLCTAPLNAVAVYTDTDDVHTIVTSPVVAYFAQGDRVRALVHPTDDLPEGASPDQLCYASEEKGFLGLGFLDDDGDLLAHEEWAELSVAWHVANNKYIPGSDDPDLQIEEELQDN